MQAEKSGPGAEDDSGTWSALLAFALGEVGLREEHFWKMSWNEYQHQVNHFLLCEWRQWDRTRRVACESYNQMNEKPLAYTDYMPLPTDPDPRKLNAKKLAEEFDFLDEMKRRGRI